jgi:hypothetical protein
MNKGLKNLTLSVMPGRYAICRLGPDDPVPDWAGLEPGRPSFASTAVPSSAEFLSVTRTAEELSVVCAESRVPQSVKCERGWRILKVEGPLDLSLTGIFAALAAPLAEARITIFAVSTFDTDYLLVKDAHLSRAVETLVRAGHLFAPHPETGADQ